MILAPMLFEGSPKTSHLAGTIQLAQQGDLHDGSSGLARSHEKRMNPIQRAVCKPCCLQWILATIFILPSAYFSRGLAESDSAPHPLWEVDLSKFEYQGRPRESHEASSRWRDRQSLVFTQENVLATTFQVRIENIGPSVRDKTLPTDPNHMVALFMDAARGEIIKKGDWPVKTSNRTWFFAGQDGQFILGMGDALTVYSPDLSVVTERTLPASYGNFLAAMPSPAADTFLVLYVGGPEIKYAWKLDLLDTTHLSELGSWTGEQAHPRWSLWGNELVRWSEHELSIETPHSEPKKVLTSTESNCATLGFINRDTLLVGKSGKGGCKTLALLSTDGKFVQELQFDSKGTISAIRASRNGKIFAITGDTAQKEPWKPFVSVFGLGSEKPLLIVDIPPASDWSPTSLGMMGDQSIGAPSAEWGAVALSPEGDLLAVRAGPILRMYRVPQAPQ
jgi:hypothetical protein